MPSLPSFDSFEEFFNNRMGMGNILSGFNFRMKPRLHPTQKPEKLIEYLVSTYSRDGDRVLDFFMGSGTTGVVCKRMNREFIGIEKDKKYFDIAEKRLSSL